MKTTLLHKTPAAHWLTTGEVAERLGCHRNTARHMAESGAFPNAIRLQRDWRVPAGDVTDYIRRQHAAAAPEQGEASD